jgi:hypothetical protein
MWQVSGAEGQSRSLPAPGSMQCLTELTEPPFLQCDLTLPRCSSCVKQNEECNIVDCVAYPYSVVAKLEDELKSLRARLSAATSGASNGSMQQGRSTSVSQLLSYGLVLICSQLTRSSRHKLLINRRKRSECLLLGEPAIKQMEHMVSKT